MYFLCQNGLSAALNERCIPFLKVFQRLRKILRVIGVRISTAFTGKGHAVRAFVTALTMPLAPITTMTAHTTMPGATVLFDAVPAE